MELSNIQQALAAMKTHMELVASNIERYKNRKKQLRELVQEDKWLNAEIGKLKRELKHLTLRFEAVLEFFRDAHNGTTPQEIFGPLFNQDHTEAVKSIEFLGYQETAGDPMPLFNCEFETYRTTLSLATLAQRGILAPYYPSYETWKRAKEAEEAA